MVLDWIFAGVGIYYGIQAFSYLSGGLALRLESKEKIESMKYFKDASKIKQGFYILLPGTYAAVKEFKKR